MGVDVNINEETLNREELPNKSDEQFCSILKQIEEDLSRRKITNALLKKYLLSLTIYQPGIKSKKNRQKWPSSRILYSRDVKKNRPLDF